MNKESTKAGALQGITLVLQVTLAVMGTAVLAPIIPKLILQFHDVPNVLFWAPLVVTIPSLVVSVSSPAVGLLADLIGRRRLLIVAVGAYGLIGILPLFLSTLPLLIASRALLGVVEGGITTVSTTLLGDYFDDAECTKWLGRQTACASVSALGLLTLGGYLGEFGWRAPFLVYLSALPLMLMLVRFTWEPAQNSCAPRSQGWRGFPWLRLGGIWVVTLAMGMMFYMVQIDLSTILGELGITSSSRIGLLTAFASLGIPLGTWIFQRAAAHLPVAGLLAIEFALLAVGFAGMSHTRDLPLFLMFVLCNQIGGGMGLPTTLTWAMRQLTFHQRGRGTGIWQAIFSLGPPAGPALLAAIAVHNAGKFLPSVQYLGLGCGVSAFIALCAIVTQKRLWGPSGA